MFIDKNAFWVQPAKGFTEKTKGVQVAKIKVIEEELQVKLPTLYKELMLLQNGGYLRNSVVDKDYIIEEFSSIEELITFATYIEYTKDLSDFKKSVLKSKAYCQPERVILFNQSGSNTVFAFDFGWLEKDKQETPKVLIIRNDSNEFENFRVVAEYSCFDEFVDGLKSEQGSRYWNDTSILIESELSVETFSSLLSEDLNVEIKSHQDDYYGWWNFERYFSFNTPLMIDPLREAECAKACDLKVAQGKSHKEEENEIRMVTCLLSPNQFLSGTYRFPEYSSYNKILSFKTTGFSENIRILALAKQIQENCLLKVSKIKIVNM